MPTLVKCILLAAWMLGMVILAAHSRRLRRLKLLLVALCGAIVSLWVFVDALSGNGLDYAVLYHLRAGMQGAGTSDFSLPITVAIIALLACAALPLLPGVQRRPTWRFTGAAFVILFLVSVTLNPVTRDISALVRQERTTEVPADIANQYARPTAALDSRRNVVILYAESFERTYLDEARFPGLTPELNRLRHKAVDFTDVSSRNGGTWTIAGMVSSLCGVPLSLSNDANGYASIGNFMPGARCLSDYLSDQGYSLEFIGGASSDFAGKGRFLASHGFSTVRDKEYFRGMHNLHANRFSPWGVHDDVLLDTLWQRFTELSAQPTPFALVGLTLDTHHPSGHIPQACLDVDYKGLGQRRPMLDAIHCSDRLIADFVRRIRASPFGKNTVVVVASDHIALPNDVSDLLRDAERRNLLLLFDHDLRPRQIDRATSTLDTGATILEALHGGTALGFGRSQLSIKAQGTSLTAQPKAGEEDHLGDYIAFSRSLWMLGTINDNLQLVDGSVRLGKQELRPPLSITADSEGQITTLGTSGIRSASRTSGSTAADALYIDRCFAFGGEDAPDEWCMWGMVDDTPKVVGERALRAGAPITELLQSARTSLPADQLRDDFIIKRQFDSSNTVVGQVTDGKLFSQFSDGILAYGPYENVCAGSYQLTLTGKASPAAGAWVDMVSEYGARTFDRFEIRDSGDAEAQTIAAVPYVFSDDLKLGEVRVGVTSQAAVRLDGYSLLPQFVPMEPGHQIDFSTAGNGDRYLSCGWSSASANGRMLNASTASLRLGVPEDNGPHSLTLTLSANAPQRVKVLGDEQVLATIEVDSGDHPYTIELPESSPAGHAGQLTLTLVPEADGCRPAGQSETCSLGLSRLEILAAPAKRLDAAAHMPN